MQYGIYTCKKQWIIGNAKYVFISHLNLSGNCYIFEKINVMKSIVVRFDKRDVIFVVIDLKKWTIN